MSATAAPTRPAGGAALAGIVLGTLITVAAVASLPLTMANVALPSIGASFDASQTQLNLMAILGVTLATGYAAAMTASIAAAPQGEEIPASVTSSLTMSYAGAQSVAAEYPQYASQITTAANSAFLAGDQYAYITGIIAVLIGAALVFFVFPKRDKEREVLVGYHTQDMAAMAAAVPAES